MFEYFERNMDNFVLIISKILHVLYSRVINTHMNLPVLCIRPVSGMHE